MKPYVLTIAGFDPSSGAGLTSDIKTFEANKVHGLSVCTAITVQNDIQFESLTWVSENDILSQLKVLLKRFDISVVKVGLIESLSSFSQVINILQDANENCKIVWDPILKSTSGFLFHTEVDQQLFSNILDKITLITPNIDETKQLFPSITDFSKWNSKCSLLLKGGHSKNDPIDILYSNDVYKIHGKRINSAEKHGTGCVLSSAIASNLANGFTLKESCVQAKKYIEEFINSNDTHLGEHNYNFFSLSGSTSEVQKASATKIINNTDEPPRLK